ncbi:MAG: DUF2079 domain-containing protein [Proteobacteria bacterium]|nr:MAG: DUF2079 domain-containing protein [Pseudomonadota bacterium]
MKIWDLLFGLLVGLPILTGGFWYRGGNFRVEYTQPAGAALILGIWLWLACRRREKAWEESLVIRALTRGFRWWNNTVKEKGVVAFMLPWLFFGGLWFGASLSRHLGFNSHAMDLGIFTNGIWNITEIGWPYSPFKGGTSLLADHQIFLLYPISLIFRLWRDPIILLALQAWGLTLFPVATYLLLRQRLGRESPFNALLPLLLFTYAPIRAANLFDFHPEVLMLPLFLFAVWGLQERGFLKRAFGTLLFAAALCAKESAGPVAFGIGFAWILGAGPEETRRTTRIIGVISMIAGLGMFYFDTKIVPTLLALPYVYSDLYAPFGSTLGELAKAPFTHTSEFFTRIFSLSRWRFLSALLLPLLLLPLAGWPALIAAAPGFFMLALSKGDLRLSTGFHYAIEPAIGMLLALPVALSKPFVQRFDRILLLLLPFAFLLAYNRSEVFYWRYYSLTPHLRWVRSEVLPLIRPEAAVATPGVLAPHLSARHWINSLPNIQMENGKLVDCVVWEHGVDQNPLTPASEQSMRVILGASYEEEFTCNSFTLYRHIASKPCLVKALNCPGAY